MAIGYTGHSALDAEETQRRIDHLQRRYPDWFGPILRISGADGLGPFGLEIARDFGIAARCRFSLYVRDKERLAEVDQAVEAVYRVFGTDNLVITWEMDSIRPPLQPYAPMDLDRTEASDRL